VRTNRKRGLDMVTVTMNEQTTTRLETKSEPARMILESYFRNSKRRNLADFASNLVN
jgi:hypothetical protein